MIRELTVTHKHNFLNAITDTHTQTLSVSPTHTIKNTKATGNCNAANST